MNLLRACAVLMVVAMLAACASAARPALTAPALRLSPASLGRSIALQQRLAVTTQGRTHLFEVALEVDPQAVRMAVLDLGQTVARLEWDGRHLKESRAPGWPDAVRGDRILGDLQLVHWPVEAIRQALPAGWTLEAQPHARTLLFGDEAVVRVRYTGAGEAELDQLAEGYRVRIESRNLGVAR